MACLPRSTRAERLAPPLAQPPSAPVALGVLHPPPQLLRLLPQRLVITPQLRALLQGNWSRPRSVWLAPSSCWLVWQSATPSEKAPSWAHQPRGLPGCPGPRRWRGGSQRFHPLPPSRAPTLRWRSSRSSALRSLCCASCRSRLALARLFSRPPTLACIAGVVGGRSAGCDSAALEVHSAACSFVPHRGGLPLLRAGA